jgi:acetaldehyde dehydrogenase/alcohol dehydrogenase
MAGLKVPPKTKVLVGEVPDVDVLDPMAHEKLSPILTLYPCPDFAAGVDMARQLIELGGFGHTSVIYTDPQNDDRIDLFAQVAKTGRILVNMPSSQGAIGDIYNFRLEPSLTLGCGSWGGNSVSENVGGKTPTEYQNPSGEEGEHALVSYSR